MGSSFSHHRRVGVDTKFDLLILIPRFLNSHLVLILSNPKCWFLVLSFIFSILLVFPNFIEFCATSGRLLYMNKKLVLFTPVIGDEWSLCLNSWEERKGNDKEKRSCVYVILFDWLLFFRTLFDWSRVWHSYCFSSRFYSFS
jgi:hypothetical protein